MKSAVIFSKASDEWATPRDLFAQLDRIYGFTLDPCSTHENATCEHHYTIEDDGLSKCWAGERVFVNPPYSRVADWMKKCHEESRHCPVIVALVYARTDTRWFHDYVYHKAKIRFIKGRLRFNNAPHNAPAPSMIITWGSAEEEWDGA